MNLTDQLEKRSPLIRSATSITPNWQHIESLSEPRQARDRITIAAWDTTEAIDVFEIGPQRIASLI